MIKVAQWKKSFMKKTFIFLSLFVYLLKNCSSNFFND